MGDVISQMAENPWMLQACDKIVASFVDILKAEPTFAAIYGDSIFPYKRMDIGARELPAIRVYNDAGHKEGETWYTHGDLTIDIIFPLSVRRDDLQKLTDLATAAIMAEFHRPSILTAMRESVPGLNELGKNIDYDKALMFQPAEEDDPVPMTQVVANWRVLTAEWDKYLEDDYRTPDDPFERTLADLKTLYFTTYGITDDGTKQVTIATQLSLSQTKA